MRTAGSGTRWQQQPDSEGLQCRLPPPTGLLLSSTLPSLPTHLDTLHLIRLGLLLHSHSTSRRTQVSTECSSAAVSTSPRASSLPSQRTLISRMSFFSSLSRFALSLSSPLTLRSTILFCSRMRSFIVFWSPNTLPDERERRGRGGAEDRAVQGTARTITFMRTCVSPRVDARGDMLALIAESLWLALRSVCPLAD